MFADRDEIPNTHKDRISIYRKITIGGDSAVLGPIGWATHKIDKETEFVQVFKIIL